MEINTKRKLHAEELEAIVRQTFGEQNRVVECTELKGGMFCCVLSILLHDGLEVILKLAPPDDVDLLTYEKDIMKNEVEVLRLFKASGKLPVPGVLHFDSSRNIINREYFFMEKIPGHVYWVVKNSLPEADRNHIESELGRYNKIINSVTGNEFGSFSDSTKRRSSWADTFLMMVDDLLQDGHVRDVKLPMKYNELRSLLESKKEILNQVVKPCLVHYDLWDGNVIIDESGTITGLIDFERVLWGDPLMEFYFGNLRDCTYFSRGYGFHIASEGARYRRSIYNVYFHLIKLIECAYRGANDEGHRNWAFRMLENVLEPLQAQGMDIFPVKDMAG